VKKRTAWISLIIVIALIAAVKIKMGSSAITVEFGKVIRGSIEEYIEEIGDLLLEEEIAVYSVSAGKILQVTKKAGETVKAGEVLARIDNSDLLLKIKALEAQKLVITAKFDEAKNPADDEDIRRLNAQVRSAEALYEELKRTADSNKVLYEAGALSLETYRNSLTNLAAAEAGLETAASSLKLAEKEISGNVRKQYEAQLSEINAGIEQLKLKSEDMIVRSPIDGTVMTAEIKEGNMVQAGTLLFDIGGSKGYYIECYVLAEDIAGIKPGTPVIIDNEDIGIMSIKGEIRKIHPKAESIMSDLGIEQKRIRVEIESDNLTEELRPGYEMNVKIITRSRKETLIIPEKAVFNYQGRDHVFVIENSKAKLRAIVKGIGNNDQVEILKGLEEGENIILSPDETLKEGIKIQSK